MTSANYNERLWSNVKPELDSYVDEAQFSGNRWVVLNDLASVLAIDTILEHPGAYGKHVFAHALVMWRYVFATPLDVAALVSRDVESSNQNVNEHARFANLRSNHPDPGVEHSRSVAMLDVVRLPWRMAETLRNSFGTATFIASLALAYLGCRRAGPQDLLGGYVGIGLQAYILLTVLAQVALLRYAYPATPLVVATILLCGQVIQRYLQSRRSAHA